MICIECNLEKTKDEMGSSLGRNGIVYARKACKKCINKKYIQKRKVIGSRGWFSKKYYKLKRNAAIRNYAFNLSLDEYIQVHSVSHCFYCEEVPDIKTIDRMNNDVGYVLGNCVMSCMKCNVLKGTILKSDKERMMSILNKL